MVVNQQKLLTFFPRYYCILFLARIRSSPLVQLDPFTVKRIDEIINSFLAKNKPSDISRFEENHNYVWVSMIPFVSLAFSGRQVKEKNSGRSLHEGMPEEHQDTLQSRQDQPDGPNLLPANQFVDMEGSSHALSQNSVSIKEKMKGSDNSNLADAFGFSDAQLSTMAVKETGAVLGSTQTQKLGLFTLQHMLYSSGNRQIVEGENLLLYLNCLCWHINSDDGRLLKAELRKCWSPRVASLAVICKSSLAFVCGFEAALKM